MAYTNEHDQKIREIHQRGGEVEKALKDMIQAGYNPIDMDPRTINAVYGKGPIKNEAQQSSTNRN